MCIFTAGKSICHRKNMRVLDTTNAHLTYYLPYAKIHGWKTLLKVCIEQWDSPNLRVPFATSLTYINNHKPRIPLLNKSMTDTADVPLVVRFRGAIVRAETQVRAQRVHGRRDETRSGQAAGIALIQDHQCCERAILSNPYENLWNCGR